MSNLKYILVQDFETSGLPEEGGKPIECAAILTDLKLNYIDSCHFFMYLEEGETMAEEALNLHGRTPEWLKNIGVSRKQGSEFFLNWLLSHGVLTSNKNMRGDARGQLMPMGQNVQFDLQFMEMLIDTERMKVFTHRVKDTMSIANFINDLMIDTFGFETAPFVDEIHGYPSGSLIAQMQYYDMDTDGAHGALSDTWGALNVYKMHIQKFKELLLK